MDARVVQGNSEMSDTVAILTIIILIEIFIETTGDIAFCVKPSRFIDLVFSVTFPIRLVRYLNQGRGAAYASPPQATFSDL